MLLCAIVLGRGVLKRYGIVGTFTSAIWEAAMRYRISKGMMLKTVLPALAFSLFYALVLPLSSYVANRDMFHFSLIDLLPIIICGFCVIFACAYCLSVVTEPVLNGMVPALLVALAIWGYLEIGVLSIGLPQIDGTLDQFLKPSLRKYIDLCVLCGLLLAAICLHGRMMRVIHWICFGVIVLSIASVFDANTKMVSGKSNSKFDFGRTSVGYDVVKSAVFSSVRNVIVISLDATPCDIANEIFLANEELRKKFVGFTIYKNNIGMHEKTIRGLPSIMTGKYLQKDDEPKAFIELFWGSDSCLNAYLGNGYSMFVNACLVGGFTNRRKIHTVENQVQSGCVLFEYTSDSPYITFYDVMRFRITPYRYKLGYIINALSAGYKMKLSAAVSVGVEDDVYSMLKQSEIVDGVNTMHYYHTGGVHLPISRGMNGEKLPQSVETIDAIKDYLTYILKVIGGFLDHLRENGIYDNSLIVITTDHGILSEALAPIPKSALLMVKPINEKSDFNVSELPTSHSRISDLLKRSATDNLTAQEIGMLLSQKERLLRVKQKTPEKWWYFGRAYETYDIFFDENGNEIRRVNRGVFKTL